ncbi:unnamed protein product [Paramecium sonneborni]|uniref:Transmembrane protein n=1 Tax=Paramecium sonneborni TaxID=65129 RepID=A0A8S1L5W5_9CILI|nr:unnamed protein product [Paramecium sonneborni]
MKTQKKKQILIKYFLLIESIKIKRYQIYLLEAILCVILFIIRVHILNNNHGMEKMIKILYNILKQMICLKTKTVLQLKMRSNIQNTNILRTIQNMKFGLNRLNSTLILKIVDIMISNIANLIIIYSYQIYLKQIRTIQISIKLVRRKPRKSISKQHCDIKLIRKFFL